MLAALPDRHQVIALDVKGRSWSTEELAQQLDGWMQDGRDISLLVGGPDGLAAECLQRAEQTLVVICADSATSAGAGTAGRTAIPGLDAEQRSPLSPRRMNRSQLILASASPRRCELLAQIGIGFDQQVADIDETPAPGESAEDYVRRMALEKARAVRRAGGGDLPVLGADTVVVVDGMPLGKPQDFMHARQMLKQLSGRMHEVLSAVALVETARGCCCEPQQSLVSETGRN